MLRPKGNSNIISLTRLLMKNRVWLQKIMVNTFHQSKPSPFLFQSPAAIMRLYELTIEVQKQKY